MANILIGLLSVLCAWAFADTAKLVAFDGDFNEASIALDSKKEPLVNGDPKSNPTIKDFRIDADYGEACYKGELAAVRPLLEALVRAADGDGDSWAKLVSLKEKKKIFTVVAEITNEGGKTEEEFKFEPCNTKIVKCSVTIENKEHSIRVRFEGGKIVPWNKKQWAQLTPKAPFSWFAKDREDSFEGQNSYKTKKGFNIVELITMADSVTLGVNLKTQKGFYRYRDTGSGSGNKKLELTCEVEK